MEATYLECPAGKDALTRLADTVLVVQGKEFLAHAAILGRESQVLAGAFNAQRGTADLVEAGSSEPAQKRLRLDGSGAAAAGSSTAAAQAELMRLEEPFKGFNAPEVELFLMAVYRPEGLEGLVKEELASNHVHLLAGVIRLADFLDATRVLERIAAALLAARGELLPGSGDRPPAYWVLLLVLADGAQNILPSFYHSILEYTTRLFGASLVSEQSSGATPFQQLVGFMETTMLSQRTWRALMVNSLAVGRHLVQGNRAGAATLLQSYSAKPLTLLPIGGSGCSFEWEWELHTANLAELNSEHRAHSSPFTAANCEWQLSATVPIAATAADKAVHLCLQPRSDGGRVPLRRLDKVSFVIKDTQGVEYKQIVVKTWQLTDKRRPVTLRFISVAELQDAGKGYLRDGKLHIRVELEGVRVLDA